MCSFALHFLWRDSAHLAPQNVRFERVRERDKTCRWQSFQAPKPNLQESLLPPQLRRCCLTFIQHNTLIIFKSCPDQSRNQANEGREVTIPNGHRAWIILTMSRAACIHWIISWNPGIRNKRQRLSSCQMLWKCNWNESIHSIESADTAYLHRRHHLQLPGIHLPHGSPLSRYGIRPLQCH